MLGADRQKIILDRLYQNNSVRVSELSEEFDVHEETIRRDLKSLANNWDIELVYGGAVLKTPVTGPSVEETAMKNKREVHYEEKQLIAKKAASLIKPGETIGLNSGSTVEYILDYIKKDQLPLNIVTLNVHLASKAAFMDDVEVFVPQGKIWKKSGAIISTAAVEFMRSFTIDKCFLGISAFNLQKGICHPNFEEVEGNQAMLQASREAFIVTDSSKINQSALYKMFKLDDVSGFVVDDDFPKEYREYLTLHKIQVL